MGELDPVGEARDFTFSISLYGGGLATMKVPVPITKRNLERLNRMIGEQLEPLVNDSPSPAPEPSAGEEEKE